MIDPEWTTLRSAHVPGIEVQLRRYDLPRPTDFVTREERPILSLMLRPHTVRRIGRYEDFGAAYHGLGDIVFTPARVGCRFQGDGGRPLVLSCLFDDALFRRATTLDGDWDARQLQATFDLGGEAGGPLDPILRRLVHELEMPGFASATMVEGLGLTALAELTRRLGGAAPIVPPSRDGLSPAHLRRIVSYVEETSGRTPSITDLARQCGMGPRRFSTLFRQSTGQTVREWVERLRMDKARRLLAETDLPMKAIAFDLGFASQAVFSMAFRRRAGVPPSTYRASCGRRAAARFNR